MTIQDYAQTLLETIKNEKASKELSDITKISKMINHLNQILNDLKMFTRRYSFISIDEETHFFKEVKPLFISQLIFYKILFKIQLHQIYDGGQNDTFYEKYEKKFERFVRRHAMFFQYCMSGDSRFDRLYFTRGDCNARTVHQDETFTTGYDEKLGRFLAYQLASQHIQNLRRSDEHEMMSALPALSWTASKVSLVELAYALYASRVFDNGQTSIRQIISVLEQLTGLDLENYRRIFADIKLRKNGPSSFLDQLSKAYNQYIDSTN